MFNTATTRLFIVPPTISPFRWGWDSKPWVPLIFHYLLQLHRRILPMFSLRLKNPPNSLSGFNTSANRSMRFCRNPIISTISAMINTRYHTSFRWGKRYSYIFIKNTLQGPIRISFHFTMVLILSPRLWVSMILISTLYPSLACT
jgi:hypothetical protein